MTLGAGGAAAGGAAAAAAGAIANAIKASGAIIWVEPEDFRSIVERNEKPLVVATEPSFFHSKYCYLTAYRGLIFFTKSGTPLMFKGSAEIVRAKKIWIPG